MGPTVHASNGSSTYGGGPGPIAAKGRSGSIRRESRVLPGYSGNQLLAQIVQGMCGNIVREGSAPRIVLMAYFPCVQFSDHSQSGEGRRREWSHMVP